jgi:hypothetical protein
MKKQKPNFNAWMDHIAEQLQADYKKLYYSSKFNQNENFSRVSRKESEDLRGVQAFRIYADQ